MYVVETEILLKTKYIKDAHDRLMYLRFMGFKETHDILFMTFVVLYNAYREKYPNG